MKATKSLVMRRGGGIVRGTMLIAMALSTSVACIDGAGEWGYAHNEPAGDIGEHTSAVVYGHDDRMDVYAHTDHSLRFLAMRASVVLMRSWRVDISKHGAVKVDAPALASTQLLCAGERFRDDPAAGFCSGVLIDDDLVLTAGHCIRRMEDCSNTSIVFKFYRSELGAMQPLVREDVYRCASIVAREQSSADGRSLDYAIVQLDRPATPRFTPAPVRTDRLGLPAEQQVAIVGSPSGIPLKIDAGGRVRDPRDGTLDYFVATTDSFGGNSGSPVYELHNYRLAGILVRGETDYTWTGSCRTVNSCQEHDCRGEDITYVSQAVDSLCGKQFRPRLCL